jgi:cytochrome c-type protein NapB
MFVTALGCAREDADRVAVSADNALDSRVADAAAKPAFKTAAIERAARRAYDGAPPVAPHENFGITCTECHDREGMAIDEIGFAPPSPHEITAGMSAISRCTQCHVFRQTDDVFVANRFVGLSQDLRAGARLNALAPPTIPHKTFMRENCAACHSGPAAREEIRTPHPERIRCRQCHVAVTTHSRFAPG